MTCESRMTSATITSTIPEGGPCCSLRHGFKAEEHPPPTVATAPLRADGEGPFSKVTVQSLV